MVMDRASWQHMLCCGEAPPALYRMREKDRGAAPISFGKASHAIPSAGNQRRSRKGNGV
jgi:hypothetical protein